MIHRAAKSDSDRFVSLDNALVQDASLSYEALGMLTYLLSQPRDWKVIVRNLMQRCGRSKATRILNDLVEAGYVVKHGGDKDEDGRFVPATYDVYERPPARSGSPVAENPQRKTRSGKPTATNNIKTNNTSIKNKKTKDTNTKRLCTRQTFSPPPLRFGDGGGGSHSDRSQEGPDVKAENLQDGKQDAPAPARPVELKYLKLWPGDDINPHPRLLQAAKDDPARVVGWMCQAAKAVTSNSPLEKPEAFIAARVMSKDAAPPPRSATPPAPRFAALWEAARELDLLPERNTDLPRFQQIPRQQRTPESQLDKLWQYRANILRERCWWRDVQIVSYTEDDGTACFTLRAPASTLAYMRRKPRFDEDFETEFTHALSQPVRVTWQAIEAQPA